MFSSFKYKWWCHIFFQRGFQQGKKVKHLSFYKLYISNSKHSEIFILQRNKIRFSSGKETKNSLVLVFVIILSDFLFPILDSLPIWRQICNFRFMFYCILFFILWSSLSEKKMTKLLRFFKYVVFMLVKREHFA